MVARDVDGRTIVDDETEEQTLDRWADEMTGEALVGRALLQLHQQQKK